MADPAAHGIDLSDGTVYARYNEMKERLTKQTYRWEELSITLENLKDSLPMLRDIPPGKGAPVRNAACGRNAGSRPPRRSPLSGQKTGARP